MHQKEKVYVGGNEVTFPETGERAQISVGCEIVSKELFLKIGKRAGWI